MMWHISGVATWQSSWVAEWHISSIGMWHFSGVAMWYSTWVAMWHRSLLAMGYNAGVLVWHHSGMARTWKCSWDGHMTVIGWLWDRRWPCETFLVYEAYRTSAGELSWKILPLYEEKYGKRPFSSLGLLLSFLTIEQIYIRLRKFNI